MRNRYLNAMHNAVLENGYDPEKLLVITCSPYYYKVENGLLLYKQRLVGCAYALYEEDLLITKLKNEEDLLYTCNHYSTIYNRVKEIELRISIPPFEFIIRDDTWDSDYQIAISD